MLTSMEVRKSYHKHVVDHVLGEVMSNYAPSSFLVTAHVTMIQEEKSDASDDEEDEDDSTDDDDDEGSSEYETDNEESSNMNNGVPEHLLDGLKKEDYKAGEDGEEENECTICTESLDCHEVIRCPCSHTSHSGCLMKWLLVNNSCPVCRRPVV
ncbi:hypothetical protein MKW94_021690 [Papaver nudicaule]|uniref:RING-type domain-containing protein n=1 Tax=Papaver nudicaule TaxID=74823 RepID=A0AA41SME7_PAPNU|nr:hypothetical protein [Papaver nudicaule]